MQALKLILNVLDSDVFFLLCREYSTLVSGGQVDLSPNQIATVPCPAFRERYAGSEMIARECDRMSTEQLMLAGEYMPLSDRNRIAAEYFGIALEEWPVDTNGQA